MPPQGQNDWFNAAYWIAMHRPLFYKAVIFVFLFSNGIMWGIGGFLWFNHLIGTAKYNAMMKEMFSQTIDYRGFHQRQIPKPLSITEETALISSGSKADAIAKIINPNPKWYVPELEYQFTVNGITGPVEKAWILPSDERYVASFLIPANIDLKKNDPKQIASQLNSKLTIKKIRWQRFKTNPVKMPMFEFKNQSSGQSRFSATIANKTILSFWSVGVYMVRYGRASEIDAKNEKIIGAKFLTLDNVTALKEKNFSIKWDGDPRVSKMVVEGEVDPYNSDNVLPFDQGGATQQF